MPKDNAISPEKPPKKRLAVGTRVRVVTENEDKEGLYFDDDRVPRMQAMVRSMWMKQRNGSYWLECVATAKP